MAVFLLLAGFVTGETVDGFLAGGWVETAGSGIEVDLVAIDDGRGNWWRPDGTPVGRFDVGASGVVPKEGQIVRRFLMRGGDAGDQVSLRPSVSGADFYSHSSTVSVGGRPLDSAALLSVAYKADALPEAATVSVAVTSGDWTTVTKTETVGAVVAASRDGGRRATTILVADLTGTRPAVTASVALWPAGKTQSETRLIDEYRLVAFDAAGQPIDCPTLTHSAGHHILLTAKTDTAATAFELQKRARETVAFEAVQLRPAD